MIGPPGVGKSSLARQLSNDHADLRLADLSAVSTSEELISAIAAADGAIFASPPPLEHLIEQLEARSTLFIFDNCEHLGDEAAALVHSLLSHCRFLRILVTGSRPLGIEGEQVFRVAPLRLPTLHHPWQLDDLAEQPAVNLLLQRLACVRPGFTLTDHNASAIAHQCQLLDGLPLALELADKRLKVLQPQTLVDQLSRGDEALGAYGPQHAVAEAIPEAATSLPESDPCPVLLRACLTVLAMVAKAAGRHRWGLAIRLLSMRHKLAAADGAVLPRPLQAFLEAITEQLRQEVGATEFANEWARARSQHHTELLAQFRSDLGQATKPSVLLTRRQREVAELDAAGLTNREIARQLGVAEWTAVNHVRSLLRKLRYTSRVEIARWFADHGG
ncbi:LuxR C-terminal-related transcriptional regulator [Natronoglycomyces albus]|uniref:HTH luxR-type domain-containing protein n=1 Tax=Natronoglycomyces albus TaxID=2811108 RepID=A0A895XRI8_9ACTN|nr:LuxR C-terminal-related transcriptional regulator [Natronoglycomyces albus]QSB06322.1 hypothetical protein JQS30_05275 [Natronoglycomyces albus]